MLRAMGKLEKRRYITPKFSEECKELVMGLLQRAKSRKIKIPALELDSI